MMDVTNVTKRFGTTTALDRVSCSIPQGCLYGMVGSNGAGKSTLLRLMAGIYRADEGRIAVDDRPVYENPAVKSAVVLVPDELFFLDGANLLRMAKFYRAVYPGFCDEQAFHQLVDCFGLDVKKPLSTFSKGMRRQAALLLALACRPQYLLLDETFDGLDPVVRGLVKRLLCEQVTERQMTALIATHSLRELEDIGDRLLLLHGGTVALEEDVTVLKTSLCKVQVAFSDGGVDEGFFDELKPLQIERHGSVTHLILRGYRAEVEQRLRAQSPLLLDVLPLTLEEVFTCEMQQRGYTFDAGGETP